LIGEAHGELPELLPGGFGWLRFRFRRERCYQFIHAFFRTLDIGFLLFDIGNRFFMLSDLAIKTGNFFSVAFLGGAQSRGHNVVALCQRWFGPQISQIYADVRAGLAFNLWGHWGC
jgi:hypothetical protein